jgi:hypothetical protein
VTDAVTIQYLADATATQQGTGRVGYIRGGNATVTES